MAGKAGSTAPTTTDAVDVAMEIAGDGHHARTLLEKHSRLIDAQVRTERLEHRNKLAMIAFRSILAMGALAVVLGFLWMVASARRDRGLVIQAFSVPPDLAARGLTGETIAANLADKLAEIDRTARSFRSPKTMTVNWGNDVRIQIPETGVSIGEVDAFLRRMLGQQTVIGGSVFRSPGGLRLTVRAGGSGAVEQVGSDATLEPMVQKAAEGVFEKTQPYRYSKYLEFTGRKTEAMRVARTLAETSDDPKERAWAWAQIANLLIETDTRAGVAAAFQAIREDPTNALAYLNAEILLGHLSHDRSANALGAIANTLGSRDSGGLSDVGVNTSRANLAFAPGANGDFAEVMRRLDRLSGPTYGGIQEERASARAATLRAMHDASGARRIAGTLPDTYFVAHFGGSSLNSPQFDEAMAFADYPRALALIRATLAVNATQPEGPELARLERQRHLLPKLAVALAANGHGAEARKLAASLPLDCTNCALARAEVAGLIGDLARAKRWTAEAEQQGAQVAFSAESLGRQYLRAGKYREALVEAERATAVGPRYADALKLRGDALRKLGRLDEAVDFYARAENAAPRWGRLQIDWGVAAARQGRKSEAKEHFERAMTMDLSAADRSIAARIKAMVGR